jgi:hypothetical protein
MKAGLALFACLSLALGAQAQMFTPSVVASIDDSPRDGLGDAFNNAPFDGLLRQTASTEDRAIQEFDLSSLGGASIASATLSGTVFVNNAFDNGLRVFDFSLYAGNGAADFSDFQIASSVVGQGSYHPPLQTSFVYSFDVTGTLQALLSGGAQFVGLKVDCNTEPNFPNILDNASSQLVVVTATCGAVTSYCTAGTTTNGCTATISGSGTPDANAGSGFTISLSTVEGQKQGILFYGITSAIAQPWATGSTSFLCVKAPTQRMGVQNTGGTLNACDGSLSVDWNAFIASNPGALGNPFLAGQPVYAQGWFRDPPAPKTTSLSNALQFTVCP